MKTRHGFVSNSSSSSFIIGPDQLEEWKKFNTKYYKVSDLIKELEKFEVKCPLTDDDDEGMPYFISMELSWGGYTPNYLDELRELEKGKPGCYISGSYDRDDAYRKGITDHFELFAGDL